ncbi:MULTISPECIES: LysR family transcriptional regulator [unclassified Herbaspirillum]|uniref:LysR family transcriptional regulator n=1 Tax=unclassified Herbaspirillum TaxID=2624150 RepID=UPI000E2F8CA0|nr:MULTISPECIES: LysR family transcriptional regulator [unclassified Herbaspirillum]RFB67437.1 LysR family transcriptional regulator [Herbaspirillum sp. 3R-3a1]TFI05042.1 LysR family transcriptional regulator [Herbaspirillum sp. 3R11]TFI12627.1 LysR family transcriptional regulator [Herbaspirillum sp. 3R-11]TFI22992.1 LysR family transcriptional regulator [Herbaspirillum sp. 3C11]
MSQKHFSGVDLDGVRGFVAVAERQTFADAALSLNISASALTRRIQRLETAIGTPLLERTTRRVALTPAGQLFLPGAQRSLQELTAALRLVDDAGDTRTGQIVVACIPTVAKQLLPRIIRDYRLSRPDVRIRMIDGTVEVVARNVRDGTADLGLTFPTLPDPDFVFDALLTDPYCLVCPIDHPLAALPEVRWTDLKPYQLIISGSGSGNRIILDQALRAVNWQPERPVEIEHLTTSLGLVEAGLGISVVPQSALPGEMSSRIAVRPLISPTVSRTIGLVRRRGVTLTPLAQHFLRAVRRMAPELERESVDYSRKMARSSATGAI